MATSLLRRASVALLAFSILLPSTGLAATTSNSDVIPNDITTFTQIDLTQFTPKSLVDSLVNFAAGMFDATPSESLDDADTMKKSTDFVKDMLMSGPFGNGVSLDTLQNYFVSTINDVQWTNYLDLGGKNFIKKTYNTHEYYMNGEKSVARVNQFFIGADSEKSMKTLFDKLDSGEVLSGNKDYQTTVGSVGAGSLLTSYLDLTSPELQGLKSDFESGDASMQSILDVAKHMGIALQQFTGGVSMSAIINYDAGAKNGSYTSSPFAPSLYQYATARHPLLYMEGSNFAKAMKEYDISMAADLEDFTNLMTKGYSFTVEKGNGTFLPSFTLMADVKGDETAVTDALKKAYKDLVSAKPEDGVVVSGPSLGELYDFSITFTPDDDFWSKYEGIFPRMSTMFSLVVNLTNDGVLVVSSKPNVMASYKTSMDTTEFGNTIQRTDVSALISLNLSEFTAIMKEAAQQYYASLDEESKPYVDVNITLNAIDQIFSPWQRLSGSGTVSGTSESTTVKFYFDPRVYENSYWKGVTKSVADLDTSSTKYERVTKRFSDVPQDEWYAHDVKNLKARGVVKGYRDNSFKPEQQVTRIEFLAMLHRGVYGDISSGFGAGGSMSGDVIFKDVQPFEWYYGILDDSVKKGLVSGYSDNTFRPGALITRSEAVAMIARFYQYNNNTEFFVDLPSREDRSFGDVPDNAWYGSAVHNAYKLGVVDGTPAGKFEPGRNLNRAEAAKLISQLLRKKIG